MVYNDKDWEMLPQIRQGVMNSWKILKKFLKEEEMVRCSNGWNPLSSKPQIKKIKDWNNKKREVIKDEAPVASTSKPQAIQPPQEAQKKKKKKKNQREQYFPLYRILRIQEIFHVQCLEHGQKLDEIQGQRQAKNETMQFPKELTLSLDVVNTLTEIQKKYITSKRH
ncbi:hypothetical protein O181_046166 [Austropuccinia psidii MF-1]|uniref:No apical meristem-associated C-terminal domain-containing protein n=1 Tax=Austropuccinia psidii MF-1 TaxID=1389203 RepID=A0A9Q3DTN6_9BASI|nr:hypothetical protein [Austropuccinia psidii MF-1]